VALVFNPKTGQVLPQYHVIFDDTFSTVPYMDEGTVPPHWEDLLKHSSKKATDEEFSLAEDWMDLIEKMPGNLFNETAGSRITDPFAVVTENLNISPANAAQAAPAHTITPSKPMECKLPREETSTHCPLPILGRTLQLLWPRSEDGSPPQMTQQPKLEMNSAQRRTRMSAQGINSQCPSA
jgi:hypothetical protein